MLQRKIEKSIVKWIKENNKALLIDGARQVSKTFNIRKVLEKENCNYIEFNLLNTPEIVRLQENYQSVDDMITKLLFFTTKPLIKGETFIFFDEIQEFKELTTKIKF